MTTAMMRARYSEGRVTIHRIDPDRPVRSFWRSLTMLEALELREALEALEELGEFELERLAERSRTNVGTYYCGLRMTLDDAEGQGRR